MKKNVFIIIGIILCISISITVTFKVILPRLNKEKETVIKEIKIEEDLTNIKIKEDTNIPFNSDIKISDLIEEINGSLIDDIKINTTILGEKEIGFNYINNNNKKVSYKFLVNIYDDVKPIIWLGSNYTIDTNYDGKLEEDIMCADNETSKPNCYIEGEYDTKKVGKYNLTYVAKDRSNNEERVEFTLNVIDPSTNTNKPNRRITNYSDIIKNYKKENTKIGIDVARYQGIIDFEKVKESGVEFVFIKVGGQKGIEKDYYIDANFQRNIEGFNNVGIPVGVYVYSYANSEEKAKEEALWIIEQIKDYKIDLPIVYDWENWSFYNAFEMSLYELTNTAKVFIDTVESHGYQGALYGSKNYLEKVWLSHPGITWLAHYNETTNYNDNFKYWQICDNGKIDGIEGTVDIDIMYEDR